MRRYLREEDENVKNLFGNTQSVIVVGAPKQSLLLNSIIVLCKADFNKL